MRWLGVLWNGLLNLIFRRWWRWRLKSRFRKCVESEAAEEFLELLLKLMSISFKIDKDFRRNIEGFNGRYQFKSRDNSVTVAAIFDGKELKVKEKLIPDPDISVIFKDGQSIMNYLLADNRDILKLVLNNEVVLNGNTNYIFKFGYMANHLQLALAGKV
ncbi:MAG: hypothetical protein FJZ95_00205 [Chloroflexi bacterium]|nr:hypothetical protein [Chloroflexota bacterium]